MALTQAEVEHVARLAHIALTEAETERFRSQLSDILDYFNRLRQIDTGSLPPTSHTLPLENVARLDQPQPSLTREEMLANAPLREGNYLRVRKVLE